ncbi:MAG: hypothetical protein JWN46_85 [Acidimicrobiales bacterium]|nr:hypothetical protein [Acidimicrobiales bacterium]
MSSAAEVAADLRALAVDGAERVHRTVVYYGALLQTEVKRNASGRPGPNAITGDYRRSIGRETRRYVDRSVCTISTNRPQAMRLEMGFVGTDSLGRVFDSPALPHFGPALDAIEPQFVEALQAALLPEGL